MGEDEMSGRDQRHPRGKIGLTYHHHLGFLAQIAGKVAEVLVGHVPELQHSRRFAIAISFACSTPIKSWLTVSDGGPPCAAKPLLFTRWDNPLLYAWATPSQRLPPRRHIGVTCGGSRSPMGGRCSRE